jgi:hypothetical protein
VDGEALSLEEEIKPLLNGEDNLPAARAARKEPRHVLEAVGAVGEAVDQQILRVARSASPAVHAAEAARVEQLPVRVDSPPRRNQPSALAAAIAEALPIALLMQDHIVLRNAALRKPPPAQRAPEAVDVPVVVSKLERITSRRTAAAGARALRDFGDVPQSVRGTVLPNNDRVHKREKTSRAVLH